MAGVDTSKVVEHMTALEAAQASAPEPSEQPKEEKAEQAEEPKPADESEGTAAPEAEKAGEASADSATERQQQAPQVFEIVVNGRVEKVQLDELISRAQKGTDYTQKTQAVSKRAKELEQLINEYEPWLKKAQELAKQEKEAEEQDPLVKAQRTAERAQAAAEALHAARERDQATARQEAILRQVVDAVDVERKKYKVFEKVAGDAEIEETVAEIVSAGIVNRGLSPDQAVSRAAKMLEKVIRAEQASYLKGKIGDANKSPVPKQGAPAPSKVTKMTAADLKSGKVLDAVRRRLEAADSPD